MQQAVATLYGTAEDLDAGLLAALVQQVVDLLITKWDPSPERWCVRIEVTTQRH